MPKKKKGSAASAEEPAKPSLYTIALSEEQMEKLKAYCDHHLWEFFDVDHARFGFKNKQLKATVVGYKSGKCVISGKGTQDFVVDVIEAEITGEPKFGYDEVHHPEWFEAHAGLDEAGKGDVFGPLVCATVIADPETIRDWVKKGVKDSKRLTDSTALRLEKMIRSARGAQVATASCSMAKYNQLMAKPNANLNRLVAWLHARALEDALKWKRVPWGMLDQFSKRPLVQNYFKDESFDLRMQTKAEADPVVAAASIVARAAFVKEMAKLSERAGETLLKGASAQVREQAVGLVEKFGSDGLGEFAKLHFRTCYEARGLPVPEKKVWRRGGPAA